MRRTQLYAGHVCSRARPEAIGVAMTIVRDRMPGLLYVEELHCQYLMLAC